MLLTDISTNTNDSILSKELSQLSPEQLASIDQTLPTWIPRDDQMPLWRYLFDGGTRAVMVAHRRWGKDEVALHFTRRAAEERIGNYWHMLPQANQARKAIWEAINPHTGKRRIDEAFPLSCRAHTRNTDMVIELKSGSIWQIIGSDNYNSIVGSPPIGIVFSEYALADPMAWAYLSPILAENGGWAIFISTSRGNNHFKRMYDLAKATDGWFAELKTVAMTPVFTPAQLEAERLVLYGAFGEDLGEAMFQQEYFCSFEGAVLGAYYSKQMAQAKTDGRISSVPWQSGLEVYTYWDLGVDDSMTIWFMQFVGREIRVIDYEEGTGYGLEYYAKKLKERPYVYGDHYMPHDAEVREMTSGEEAKSRKQVAEDLGIRPVHVVQRARDTQAILQGIQLVRNLLSRCFFDEKKCWQGISALEGYRAEYDEEKRVLGIKPFHDWCSHAADAFRTFAMAGSIPAPKSGMQDVDFRKHVKHGTWRSR